MKTALHALCMTYGYVVLWYTSKPILRCVMTEKFHTQDGWTALHASSEGGHVDVVRALIAARAHANQQSKVI